MTASAPGRTASTRLLRHRRLLGATTAIALLTLVGACGANDDSSSGTTSADSSQDEAAPASEADGSAGALRSQRAPTERSVVDLAEADSFSAYDTGADALALSPNGGGRAGQAPATQQVPGDPRSLIKTGNVALRSDDVPTARFDVGKVLDANGGEVAEESTQADDDGDIERVRLVARVPVDAFDATMTDFEGVADLIDVSTKTQDVSTEVIDTEVRVELQRRSIERIGILLDSAGDLRDIVTIERELARREAELGSLEKRQTFLADQTAMATITLSIEPPREVEEKPAPEEDEDGFLAGLAGGWDALTDVTTGLLTAGGAVLPFAVVLLLLGVPGRLLVRRYWPRTSPGVGQAPAASA